MAVSMGWEFTINAEPRLRAPYVARSFSRAIRASAGNRARNVPDLLARVAIVDALVHPADPLAHGLVVNLQEVREVRRAHVEALVRGAEQVSQLPVGQVRMPEGRRVAVELLPVALHQQRL